MQKAQEVSIDVALAVRGKKFSYARGTQSKTVKLIMSRHPSRLIDSDTGRPIETNLVDFIGKVKSLPFGLPARHDTITDLKNGNVFEVTTPDDERPYRQRNDVQIRIHTVQIQ